MNDKEWLEHKGIFWLGFAIGCFSGGAIISLGSPVWVVMVAVFTALIPALVYFWKAT
ncbi:MAG: hypothetical protein ACYSVY_00220 [Planctomycetota bacterium]|jgi:hypothetical protein